MRAREAAAASAADPCRDQHHRDAGADCAGTELPQERPEPDPRSARSAPTAQGKEAHEGHELEPRQRPPACIAVRTASERCAQPPFGDDAGERAQGSANEGGEHDDDRSHAATA